MVNGDHVTCTFVHKRLVAITARVFHDLNRLGVRFGVRTATDPFLADWKITVYSAPGMVVATGHTASGGTPQINFGVCQAVIASEMDTTDEVTTVIETDQIYDLPLDEEGNDEEAASPKNFTYLPLVQK